MFKAVCLGVKLAKGRTVVLSPNVNYMRSRITWAGEGPRDAHGQGSLEQVH